ncbi:DMT family transporter [Steroidobacter sp. S1-65]|uniref:DMT family transporter n=1 Tax=Steroidobacter gossypii TaxID=2805490 RepID=A0ABS1WV18_9GAMM|nr:DMT family transporter [Steroidobacter gossypii]
MSNNKVLEGVACGIGAGALWGLVFLAPELVPEFGPLHLTVGRYLFYGVFSVLLIAPLWRRVMPKLSRREWIALGWLAFAGNIFYYVLLSSAVRLGGIAMTSLVIGFLPVAVTIVGSRDQGAVPLRQLAPSLALCVLGALCIGAEALSGATSASIVEQSAGLLCAIGALVSWTCYAVWNSRWLTKLRQVSGHEWNLLTGVMTCAQALLLLPFALAFSDGSHSAAAWTQLAGVSAGVAVLASITGNALWNRMSRLLPLTLVGQMILFETLFALIYGFVWEQRLPTPLETVAFTLVFLSVVSCLGVHRKAQSSLLDHSGGDAVASEGKS